MTAYKPYRHQLRRSLFASTIFPVFLVMIIVLVSFYAIYISFEHRTIHQHVEASQIEIQHTEQHLQSFITQHQHQFKQTDLTQHQDVTELKRELLNMIHQQPTTLYYEVSGPGHTLTNNYEHLDTKSMYVLAEQRLHFKNDTYTVKFYMANAPSLNKIKHSGQFALIIDQYDNILYSNNDRFTVNDKYQPPQFGFMFVSAKLHDSNHQLLIYKDIHDTIEDGITLLIIMGIVLVLLIIVGFITADKMAKRQTQDIETIIQKIDNAKHRHLGAYSPLKNHSELEEINHYIYDLFESNEQLIQSIEHSERRLRDIQLKEIERQFQPHFLFNTMQTIQYLIPLSPKVAQTTIQRLSRMLRYSLRTQSHTVMLSAELDYIKQYVAIQNIRFDNMIQLHIESSEAAQHQIIGKMMIQPLVENAIKHGRDSDQLRITIRLSLTRHALHVVVCDNGVGMTQSRLQCVRQSLNDDVFDTVHLGLNHLHHRAMIQYGKQARLHIFSAPHRGTLICYHIPLLRRESDV